MNLLTGIKRKSLIFSFNRWLFCAAFGFDEGRIKDRFIGVAESLMANRDFQSM